MANNKIKIVKKIFEEDLLFYSSGTYKGCVDWKSNIGREIRFIYGDISDKVKIKSYENKDMVIEYKNKEYNINSNNFRKGKLGILFNIGGITKEDIENQKIERLGEIKYNKYNVKIEIVEYNTEEDIYVIYNDDVNTKTNITYREFRKENRLKTPYDKTICGIGYVGVGEWKPSYIDDKGNVTPTKEYDAWRSMLRRCYANLENNKSYIGCSVCEEWHNFQNFAKWYDENYYEVDYEVMQVDKDILKKNNKIYSPDTCIIAPNIINTLFVKNSNHRGKHPIGVYTHSNGKYIAQCSVKELGRQKFLGDFDNEYNAFIAYKKFKEQHIKNIANEFKDKIPLKLYEAMFKYEIDITD